MTSRPARTRARPDRLSLALRQALGLAAAALVLATVINGLRASPMPWSARWDPSSRARAHLGGLSEISLDEAAALYRDARALFLDARDPGAFQAGHLPGALNIPPEEATSHSEEIKAMAEAGMVPVAYCDGLDCLLSAELARALEGAGVPRVLVLVNGWSRWRDAGLPTERG